MALKPLDGVYQKLIRAEEHLRILDAEIGVFLDREPYDFLVKQDPKDCLVAVLQILDQPSVHLSVVVGDCLHNLRSSLDYLACELILLNGGSLTKKSAFPIFDDAAKYAKTSLPCVAGMSVQAAALIESLQLYHCGNAPNQHPLQFLYALSNTDKHRALHLTVASMDTPMIRLVHTENGQRVFTRPFWTNPGILRHNTELAKFPMPTYQAMSSDMDVQAQCRCFISLDEAGPWGQEPIGLLLERSLQFIRQMVLPMLEPLFGQSAKSVSP